MQLLRRFTVKVDNPHGGEFSKQRDYDVLAIKTIDNATYFLVADNNKNFLWVPTVYCKLDFLYND